jgi:glutaredoxin 3
MLTWVLTSCCRRTIILAFAAGTPPIEPDGGFKLGPAQPHTIAAIRGKQIGRENMAAPTTDLLTLQAGIVYFPLLMELKLYSREWCSWCIDAKEYLESRGYKFLEIDVGEDRQAYEEMKQLSEQTYVPTFVAGEHVLANFDTNQLERFLSEHQIHP